MTGRGLRERACEPRMLYTCATAGCSEAGRGFTDEPTFCAICLMDLAGVFDATGTLRTDDERRSNTTP